MKSASRVILRVSLTAELTKIAQSWGAHKVIGVDIDESLVRAAWRRRTVVWSAQSPSPPETDGSAQEVLPDYFPLSFEHMFGSLPIPPNRNRGKHVFPHNVSFRASDWVNNQIPEDSEPYDIIIACVMFSALLSACLTLLPDSQYRNGSI